MTQHASEIDDKDRELAQLRETIDVIKREGESKKQELQAQMQQQASEIKSDKTRIAEQERSLRRLKEAQQDLQASLDASRC